MSKGTSRQFRYIIEYALVRCLLGGLGLVPFKTRVRAGGVLVGGLITRLNSPRGRIHNNLLHIFPDTTDDELRALTKTVGNNFGRSFVEILNNGDYSKNPQLRHASGPGLQVLRDAAVEGTGAIIVSGHFGQWDAARHFLKSEGIEVGAIYRPSNNHYFDRIFVPQIRHAGEPAFPSGRRGTADMVRHVRGGSMVAILPDQRFEGGEPLDFMGQPAKTSTAAASIALKYGVPLVPVYGTRRADSLDVDIVFEEPIPHSDANTMSQAINDSLTKQVRKNPGQWYWLHNRWR
ncbi:MAG: amino acid ABC transporter substrate-binding protein [Paracoccaceae bacterium]